MEIGGFLGVIGVGFWILDLGSTWISGNRRSWWHGFGLAAIGDRVVLCVVCVASSIAPMVIFFFKDRKSTRLNSSHYSRSRMPSSA